MTPHWLALGAFPLIAIQVLHAGPTGSLRSPPCLERTATNRVVRTLTARAVTTKASTALLTALCGVRGPARPSTAPTLQRL